MDIHDRIEKSIDKIEKRVEALQKLINKDEPIKEQEFRTMVCDYMMFKYANKIDELKTYLDEGDT